MLLPFPQNYTLMHNEEEFDCENVKTFISLRLNLYININ